MNLPHCHCRLLSALQQIQMSAEPPDSAKPPKATPNHNVSCNNSSCSVCASFGLVERKRSKGSTATLPQQLPLEFGRKATTTSSLLAKTLDEARPVGPHQDHTFAAQVMEVFDTLVSLLRHRLNYQLPCGTNSRRMHSLCWSWAFLLRFPQITCAGSSAERSSPSSPTSCAVTTERGPCA